MVDMAQAQAVAEQFFERFSVGDLDSAFNARRLVPVGLVILGVADRRFCFVSACLP
jgi:hypothetical protein